MRHQEIDRPLGWLREALYLRTGIRLDGRSDLYAYFILSAHDWLEQGAVAAWLLPSEFVATDFGSALRNYLTRDVSLRRLHFYDSESQLFDNARISSAVAIYEKVPVSAASQMRISRGGTLERPDEESIVPLSTLLSRDKWSWAALTSIDDMSLPSLGDLFEIKRGIATGGNAEFVLEDEDVERMQVPKDWLRPLLPKARLLDTLIVDADDHGDPVVPSRRWLIDTAVPFEQIARETPIFASYLREVERSIGGRALVRQRRPFYKQENRSAPMFVFKYMAKANLGGRDRFIWNRSDALILNNYLGLHPRPEVSMRIANDPGIEALIDEALRAIPADDFARHGRMYVSGLLKLEPGDLARVRVRIPSELVPGIL